MSKLKKWNLENLKQGFDRFYSENNKLPSANELDQTTYLPSARWVQTKFGGLIKVRKDLGYKDFHFGAGDFRRKIAKQVNNRGFKFEIRIEEILVKKFGESFVHTQKRIGLGKHRVDFYVFNATQEFGVDVVSTHGTFRDLQTNLNIKISKYKDFSKPLFFVIEGDFSQQQIDGWISRKFTPLPSSWKILVENNFILYLDTLKPYFLSRNPL